MQRLPPRLLPVLDNSLRWLAAALIMIFTYAKFFHLPYVGFDFDGNSREVYEVYVTAPAGADLQVGDRLVQVGSMSLAEFQADYRQTLFAGVTPGQTVPILAERRGQIVSIAWVIPGRNRGELLQRVNSEWWLAWLFWLAGAAASLHLRPKDERQRLLSAFCFLTAVWLSAGAVSRWHAWNSSLMLHSAVWLSVPVTLHLHWVFPKPLGRLPEWLRLAGYLGATAMAGLDWFQIPSRSAFQLGLLLAAVGSLALLVAHFIRQPAQRRDVRALWGVAGLALLLPISFAAIESFGRAIPLAGGAFLAFPALPIAYLYTAYRRQMGVHELRVNRLLSLYLFLILVVLGVTLLLALASAWLDLSGAADGIIAAILGVVVTAAGFTPFQRLIERHLLGIPPVATRLTEMYAARVATRLDQPGLVELLTKEVLPRLDVRQSALLRCEQDRLVPLYAAGVPAEELPNDGQLAALLAQAESYRPPPDLGAAADPCPWARLILPLRFGDTLIGLWLLGRRDPDDFYARVEIVTLQALAAQTAVSLTNLRQAEDLHLLSQASIERHEAERTGLARELHDDVLSQVGTLINSPDVRPSVVDALHALAERLRRTISGLRPKVLDYSLRAALDHLADELNERAGNSAGVTVEVAGGEASYPPQVEQHLYRIVQQAGENAVKHAQARRIVIRGRLDDDRVELTVEDDGRGFETAPGGSLAEFAARRRYGLTGMAERAALIGADLHIDSGPGRGARVRVTWRREPGGSQDAA